VDDTELRAISITAARCVAWRAIVSDSYRFNALRSASTRSGNGNGHHWTSWKSVFLLLQR